MAIPEQPDWQPVVELYEQLPDSTIQRAERATRNVSFALPRDKVFDLRLVYPDEVEDILETDPTISALGEQPAEHAYQADDRAERIRTRRTIVVLALMSLSKDNTGPDAPLVAA